MLLRHLSAHSRVSIGQSVVCVCFERIDLILTKTYIKQPKDPTIFENTTEGLISPWCSNTPNRKYLRGIFPDGMMDGYTIFAAADIVLSRPTTSDLSEGKG